MKKNVSNERLVFAVFSAFECVAVPGEDVRYRYDNETACSEQERSPVSWVREGEGECVWQQEPVVRQGGCTVRRRTGQLHDYILPLNLKMSWVFNYRLNFKRNFSLPVPCLN